MGHGPRPALPRRRPASLRGGGGPPPPSQGEGARAPETPKDETPTAQQELGEKAEAEVEMEVEPTPEGTEE